jgi:hypothetical protein
LKSPKNAPGGYPIGTQPGDLFVIKEDLSLCRAKVTAVDIDQGGFPRAIRPDDAQYFALFHPQVNTLKGGQSAEMFGYIF